MSQLRGTSGQLDAKAGVYVISPQEVDQGNSHFRRGSHHGQCLRGPDAKTALFARPGDAMQRPHGHRQSATVAELNSHWCVVSVHLAPGVAFSCWQRGALSSCGGPRFTPQPRIDRRSSSQVLSSKGPGACGRRPLCPRDALRLLVGGHARHHVANSRPALGTWTFDNRALTMIENCSPLRKGGYLGVERRRIRDHSNNPDSRWK